MEIERPFDALNFLKGRKVFVLLKDGTEKQGRLIAFDLNINISIETNQGKEFISGISLYSIGTDDTN